MSRWQDLGYLLETAGGRTVPVEVGSHYLASGWGQRLMLLSDFILQHVSTPAALPRADNAGNLAQAESPSAAGLEIRSISVLRFASSCWHSPSKLFELWQRIWLCTLSGQVEAAGPRQEGSGGDCQASQPAQRNPGAADGALADAVNSRQPDLQPHSRPRFRDGNGLERDVTSEPLSPRPAEVSATEPQQQQQQQQQQCISTGRGLGVKLTLNPKFLSLSPELLPAVQANEWRTWRSTRSSIRSRS